MFVVTEIMAGSGIVLGLCPLIPLAYALHVAAVSAWLTVAGACLGVT